MTVSLTGLRSSQLISSAPGIAQTANNLSDLASAATASQNLFGNAIITPTFVTNATTLTSTAYGATVQLTNAGVAGTVNLPVAVTGKVITLLNASASNAIMTIDPASTETIAGVTTLVIGSTDVVKIVGFSGLGWVVLDYWMRPCNASAYLLADEALANNTATKVTLDTIYINNPGFFDAITDYRFTPLLPGKYLVQATCTLDPTGIATLTTYTASLYLNGAAFLSPVVQVTAAATSNTSTTLSTLMYFNGTSDYVELFAKQVNVTTTAFKVAGGQALTTFSAVRVGII